MGIKWKDCALVSLPASILTAREPSSLLWERRHMSLCPFCAHKRSLLFLVLSFKSLKDLLASLAFWESALVSPQEKKPKNQKKQRPRNVFP